jgi:peptidoglycan/LPS O-acetylase OafA/YrhL
MTDWPRIDRLNNFDVIRLAAALQVAILHSDAHLKAGLIAPVRTFLEYFPGVPIFFYLSGLLVTSSLVRRPLGKYAEARIRRVFPALYLAFALALIVLIAFGQIGTRELGSGVFWIWTFTQLTVFQVFHPDMFRDFGIGVVNGSLWTIPVEIGFYVVLPVVFWLSRGSRRALVALLVLGGLVSFPIHVFTVTTEETMLVKIVAVTPAAHFWLFAMGALSYLYLDRLEPLLARLRKNGLWLAPLVLYLAFAILLRPLMPWAASEAIGVPLLAAAVLSLAMAAPVVVGALRGYDISYGLYVFHMLAVNSLLAAGFSGRGPAAVAVLASVFVALLSWRYLERIVLRRGKGIPSAAGTGATVAA